MNPESILDITKWQSISVNPALDRWQHPDYPLLVIHRLIKHRSTPPYVYARFIIWVAGVAFHFTSSITELLSVAYHIEKNNLYKEIRTGSLRAVSRVFQNKNKEQIANQGEINGDHTQETE